MRVAVLLGSAMLLPLLACSESPTPDPLAPDSPLFSHAGGTGTCLSDEWKLIEVTTREHERYDKNKNDHICEKTYNVIRKGKSFTQTEYSDDILNKS